MTNINDEATNVVVLNVPTRLDLPVERVLENAMDDGLESCLLIGKREDGSFYIAATTGNYGRLAEFSMAIQAKLMSFMLDDME